jgi:SpoIIAA-like
MPIVGREEQTKGGRHIIRCEVSGSVSGDDARALLQQSAALSKRINGSMDLLSIVATGTNYSPESSRIFTSDFAPYTRRISVVVSSKLVRAAINFMMRMSRRNHELKCFDDEASALAWLDT